jgi:hypothetical protein
MQRAKPRAEDVPQEFICLKPVGLAWAGAATGERQAPGHEDGRGGETGDLLDGSHQSSDVRGVRGLARIVFTFVIRTQLPPDGAGVASIGDSGQFREVRRK